MLVGVGWSEWESGGIEHKVSTATSVKIDWGAPQQLGVMGENLMHRYAEQKNAVSYLEGVRPSSRKQA